MKSPNTTAGYEVDGTEPPAVRDVWVSGEAELWRMMQSYHCPFTNERRGSWISMGDGNYRRTTSRNMDGDSANF